MNGNGYIKLYRKLLDNPVVCKDSDHLAVWIYLLLNATHQKQKMIFEGKVIVLQPGQLITGRKSISAKIHVSESKVQRVLKMLESEQQIEQQTTPRNRLITIVAWTDYQESERQTEQQLNNNRTTTEQQLNTNKNVNNGRSSIYAQKFEQFYAKYPKKKAKQAAVKAWGKLKPDDALFAQIMKGLDNHIRSEDWSKEDGKFIPYPASWINGRRWEDELRVKKSGGLREL